MKYIREEKLKKNKPECPFCGDKVTVAVRGFVGKEYVKLCPYHGGMLQMIFEKVNVSDSVKWRPLFDKEEN